MHIKNLLPHLSLAVFLLASLPLSAQVGGSTTTCFQPDSASSQDVTVWSLTPGTAIYGDWSFLSNAWTWQGSPGVMRGFLRFDGLASIPSNATVTSATLTLSFDPISAYWHEHSQLSGSNESMLLRVTSPWQATATTWNNQPSTVLQGSTLAQDKVILPANTSPNQNYTLNVTDMVQYWVSNPSQHHGVMLRLLTEQFYRVMIFASSDHPDSALRPQLCVTYTVPVTTQQICFQPDAEFGVDATLESLHPTTNIGTYPDNDAFGWTIQGAVDTMRSLIKFQELSTIAPQTQILNATLTLFNHPTSPNNLGQHSTASGSNAARFLRVLQPWTESNVTWANQPQSASVTATNPTDYGLLPASTNSNQDYQIDITDMVQFWIDNPSMNYGGLLRLEDEAHYRCLIFASSDQGNAALRPRLCITIPDTLATSRADVQDAAMEVFPQPAQDMLTVRFGGAVSDRRITLWNMHGQQLAARDAAASEVTLARGGLAAGVYLLRVEVPGQAPVCRKVVFE